MSATVRRLATPVVVGTGLAIVLGAGVAGAYYQSGLASSGSGNATPIATTPLTLTTTGSVSTGLYPGGSGANVTFSVTNPYTRPIAVTGVSLAGSITVVPVSGRTCVTTGVSVSAPTSGLPVSVPASGTVSVTLTGVVTMSAAAESGCQGATFTVPFQVTGKL